ncbi:MAG: hypothetical protein WC776_04930 [Patescibacteria group bacterium]
MSNKIQCSFASRTLGTGERDRFGRFPPGSPLSLVLPFPFVSGNGFPNGNASNVGLGILLVTLGVTF